MGYLSWRTPTAAKILADTKEALLDIPDNDEVFVHVRYIYLWQEVFRKAAYEIGKERSFSAVPMNMSAMWFEDSRGRRELEIGIEAML